MYCYVDILYAELMLPQFRNNVSNWKLQKFWDFSLKKKKNTSCINFQVLFYFYVYEWQPQVCYTSVLFVYNSLQLSQNVTLSTSVSLKEEIRGKDGGDRDQIVCWYLATTHEYARLYYIMNTVYLHYTQFTTHIFPQSIIGKFSTDSGCMEKHLYILNTSLSHVLKHLYLYALNIKKALTWHCYIVGNKDDNHTKTAAFVFLSYNDIPSFNNSYNL